MSSSDKVSARLIFDGDCGFCTTTARFIQRNSSVKIETEPYQWANLDEYGLSKAEAAAKVQLVSGNKVFAGHHCMAKLLLIQKNPLLKLIGAVMVLPGVDRISAKVYDWVAANRQRFPGGTPACKMPGQD